MAIHWPEYQIRRYGSCLVAKLSHIIHIESVRFVGTQPFFNFLFQMSESQIRMEDNKKLILLLEWIPERYLNGYLKGKYYRVF